MSYDFNMTGDDGVELEAVTGPGLTGLRNLGNRYEIVLLPGHP